jgi:predicted transcriptional regulator
MKMSIGEFCNREVVFATKEMGLAEAAQLMRQYHVGDLCILKEFVAYPLLTKRER